VGRAWGRSNSTVPRTADSTTTALTYRRFVRSPPPPPPPPERAAPATKERPLRSGSAILSLDSGGRYTRSHRSLKAGPHAGSRPAETAQAARSRYTPPELSSGALGKTGEAGPQSSVPPAARQVSGADSADGRETTDRSTGLRRPGGFMRQRAALTVAATIQRPLQRPKRHPILRVVDGSERDLSAQLPPSRPISMLIAHRRQDRRLEKYVGGWKGVVEEWEQAHAAAAIARQRGRDPAVEVYGKIGFLEARRKRKAAKRRDDSSVSDEEAAPVATPAAATPSNPPAAGSAAKTAARATPTAAAEPLHPHPPVRLTDESQRREAERRAAAKRSYTISEAIDKIEARIRARRLKVQLVRQHYHPDGVHQSLFSQHPARHGVGSAPHNADVAAPSAAAATTATGGALASPTHSHASPAPSPSATQLKHSTAPLVAVVLSPAQPGSSTRQLASPSASAGPMSPAAESKHAPGVHGAAETMITGVNGRGKADILTTQSAAGALLHGKWRGTARSGVRARLRGMHSRAAGGDSDDAADSEEIEDRIAALPPLPRSALAPATPVSGGDVIAAGTTAGATEAAPAGSAPPPAERFPAPSRPPTLGSDLPDASRLEPDRRYGDYEHAVSSGVVPSSFDVHMPASDVAFITFADAADAQEVMRRGKACFALGNTIPASAAVLEAYGLPPAGLNPASVNYTTMAVEQAPEPSEIIWSNTTLSPSSRWWRPAVAGALIAVVVFIAALPSVCIAALANLAPLGTVIGFLEPALAWAGVTKGLLQTLVPALLVRIIVALLRTLVRALAKLRGTISYKHVELFTARWWFTAAYIAAILSFTIASTILGSMNAIINDPTQVLVLLAESLPEQSGTFLAFVIIAAVQGWSLELLRPFHLAVWSCWRYKAITSRKIRRHLRKRASGSPAGNYTSSAALILSIGLLFQFMNPALIPCLVGYFFIASAIAPHQFLYVYNKQMETGGRFWIQAVNMSVSALLVSQTVWLVYFLIRQVHVAGYVTSVLLAATVGAKVWWVRRFDRPLAYLPPVVARAVQDATVQAQQRIPGMKMPGHPAPTSGLAGVGTTDSDIPEVSCECGPEVREPAATAPVDIAAEAHKAGAAPASAPTPAAPPVASSVGKAAAPARTVLAEHAAVEKAGAEAPTQADRAGAPRSSDAALALPGSQLKPRKFAASYRRHVDAVVQGLRNGQADLTQWYLPDMQRPSPYVAWYWKEACDIQPNGFDWTGDGASYPASRMKAWVPPTSGVPGSGEIPSSALTASFADAAHAVLTVPVSSTSGETEQAEARAGPPTKEETSLRNAPVTDSYWRLAEVETQAWMFEEVSQRARRS